MWLYAFLEDTGTPVIHLHGIANEHCYVWGKDKEGK